MMQENVSRYPIFRIGLAIFALIAVAGIAGTTLLAAAPIAPPINITINNNSQKEIRHLYLAVGDPNNWGPDQLNGSSISAGSSYTLNGVACDGASIRVIAEDHEGCFFYHTVSCSENAGWTITSDAPRDCGS